MPRYVQSRPTSHKAKLLTAIRAGNNQAFEHILETEGLPSSRHAADCKLLRKALIYGRSRMAQTLLDRGCRAYDKIHNGNSPLHLAASRRNCAKLVRRLLDHGARVDQMNRHQETPLHVAFAFADWKVVDLMLERHLRNSFANESNRIGLTYLHVAAARSNLDVVRYLVETGNAVVNCKIDVEADSPYAGFTPLHMAVEYGRRSVAEMLLSYGADLWQRNFQGSTPLHLALERKNVEMIDLLLTHDYKRENYVNDVGLSHFMATCVGSNTSVTVDYLLNPVNSETTLINKRVDKYGGQLTYPFKNYTPLHFAAEFGRQETVQLLLSNGACDRLRNDSGPMPDDPANMNNFHQAADFFAMQCHDWPPTGSSYEFIRRKVDEDVEMIVDDSDSEYCEDDDGEDTDGDEVYFGSDDELQLSSSYEHYEAKDDEVDDMIVDDNDSGYCENDDDEDDHDEDTDDDEVYSDFDEELEHWGTKSKVTFRKLIRCM